MSAATQPCASCGAPVVFATHERTKRQAPMEPDPRGLWTIVGGVYFRPMPSCPPEHRYTNHFATCPGAAGHRRTTTEGARA